MILFFLAGFSIVSLADLNPGSQLVYIVAMYISVYPVAISMRNSNIYQVKENTHTIILYSSEKKIHIRKELLVFLEEKTKNLNRFPKQNYQRHHSLNLNDMQLLLA